MHVETRLRWGEEEIAWVDGVVEVDMESNCASLAIGSWGGQWEADDPEFPVKNDVLCFQIRKLQGLLCKSVVVENDGWPVFVSDQAVAENTYYWLGF